MSAQKIPLFGGIIKPIPDGGTELVVFTPPDKAFSPLGAQATYELHLWAIFQAQADPDDNQVIGISARTDADPGSPQRVWIGSQQDLQPTTVGTPVKVLDGYPVRGKVTLIASAAPSAGAPNGPQLFGYYYRVGQGPVQELERRFIGQESDDGVSAGVPINIADGEDAVVHVFEENRIDELSLAFTTDVDVADGTGLTGTATLRFEDSANNLVTGSGAIAIDISSAQLNSARDPESVYTLYKVPFGLYPNLDHIRVGWVGAEGQACRVHGYFVRH